MAMLTLVGFYLLLRQCKFLQQVLAGHRPQSTEAERLRDQGRDPRKFQGNTRAVLQLLTLISRHRLLSRWGPFLDAVNITIEALTTKTLPSPAAAIEDGRRDEPIKCTTNRPSRLQNSLYRETHAKTIQSAASRPRLGSPKHLGRCPVLPYRLRRATGVSRGPFAIPAALGRSDCFR
jgi:hypothetical protein